MKSILVKNVFSIFTWMSLEMITCLINRDFEAPLPLLELKQTYHDTIKYNPEMRSYGAKTTISSDTTGYKEVTQISHFKWMTLQCIHNSQYLYNKVIIKENQATRKDWIDTICQCFNNWDIEEWVV